MNDCVVLLNSELFIEFANPSFLSLVKADLSLDVCGSEFAAFFAGTDIVSLLEESRISSLAETLLLTAAGETIPVDVSFSPRICSEGSVAGYIAVIRDISPRRDEMERLHQTLQRYKDMAFCSSDWMWETDPAGSFTYISSSVDQYMGYKPEELFGLSPFDFMSQEEAARFTSIYTRIASRNECFTNLINYCITKDGDELVLATSGMPIFDKNGDLKGYRGIDRNITGEVKTAESLKSTLAATQKIIEELPLGVVVIDRNKLIRQVNKRACEVIGKSRDELTGRICHTAFCPSLVDQCPILDLDRKMDRAERFVIHRDGHVIPVIKSVIPVRLNSEDLLLEVFMDVSGMKALETDLEAKNTELEQVVKRLKETTEKLMQSSRGKYQFYQDLLVDKVSVVGGIIGMMELFIEAETNPDKREMLTAIQNNNLRLTGVFRVMQDEAGGVRKNLPVLVQEFRIRKLIMQIVTLYQEKAQKKNISLEMEIDRLLLDMFQGPVRGIEVILREILDRSISSASNCVMTIGLTTLSTEKETAEVCFSVKTSQGEYSENQSMGLFSDMEDSCAGFNDFTRRFNVELTERSLPGGGSLLGLIIPLQISEDWSVGSAEILRNTRILVMERDSNLRGIYTRWLRNAGCRVETADDHLSILNELRMAARSGDPFRIAILDGDSVEDRGLIASRLIRNDTIIEGATNLVMCSSLLNASDARVYMNEGFSAFLHKPFNLSCLKNCLVRVLNNQGEDKALVTEYSLP